MSSSIIDLALSDFDIDFCDYKRMDQIELKNIIADKVQHEIICSPLLLSREILIHNHHYYSNSARRVRFSLMNSWHIY
jgi:hypothetical protein